MSANLKKIYTKGKVQIIFSGGTGAPLVVEGAESICGTPPNDIVAVGYTLQSVVDIPPATVCSVVIINATASHINGLNDLYNAHSVNKIELAVEATLEPVLFTECQTLFGWTGSLSNYFRVKHI
ncbi:MAG: hypothetical protein WC121_11575 [Candidatus Kapaibacterium sp.]